MEQLLEKLINIDKFYDKDPKIEGIARRAIDKGYNTLSIAQKAVLEPHITEKCSGVTDPGGYHNDCQIVLTGRDLLDAYELSEDQEYLLCENCREETANYEYEREKFFRD